MDTREQMKITAHLYDALTMARMGMNKKDPLNVRVAANGPTIGEVIDKALELVPDNKVVNIENAMLKNDLIAIREQLRQKTT